jgi:UDP-N-acetyl-D-glucosamine dehydrogenase
VTSAEGKDAAVAPHRPAEATVGVVGLGHVGLPLALSFAEAGRRVIGVDLDARRVARLCRGESYVEDVPSACLRLIGSRIEPTTRVTELGHCDAIVLCVPTPVTANGDPDLGPLTSAAREVSGVLRRGQLVVVESTTYPGATREQVVPVLEQSGLAAGEDFHMAFSPARIDTGRTDYTLLTTPKVVAGLTETCGDRAAELYAHVSQEIVRVSTLEVAEMAKMLEDVFRAVNVALVNELAVLADRMAIDIWEVVEAAATKPFGFMRFDPGPGMGGHCLSVAPFLVSWKARELGSATKLVENAARVNREMPYRCVEKIERALSELGRPVRGARVCVIGVAYKAGTSDVRGSAAEKIVGRLLKLGARVSYHDPGVPELPEFGLASHPLGEALADCDLAVVLTAHPSIDYLAIAERVPVVDLRGVTRSRRVGTRRPAPPSSPGRVVGEVPTKQAA